MASNQNQIWMQKISRYGEMMKCFYDIAIGKKENEFSLESEMEPLANGIPFVVNSKMVRSFFFFFFWIFASKQSGCRQVVKCR